MYKSYPGPSSRKRRAYSSAAYGAVGRTRAGAYRRWSARRQAWVNTLPKQSTATSAFQVRGNTPEYKYIDTPVANFIANSTGSVTLMNSVSVGTDFSDRIGRKIVMRSIQIKGAFASLSTLGAAACCAAFLVYDNNPDVGTPAVNDVLQSTNPHAMLNNANTTRFMLLKRWVMTQFASSATVTTAVTGDVNVDYYQKCALPVVFDNTAGAIANFEKGALWLVCVGDSAGGYNFTASCRVRFTDQ